MLLTSDEDPQDDLLGVFFADGRTAPVTSPGGWGVEVGPRKGEELRGCCEDKSAIQQLQSDAITILYWGKAAETYYWKNGRFEVISIAD